MSWIKLDDSLPSNRKVKTLSDRAFRLYVYGLCYCGRDLTDGIIDKDDERVLRAAAKAQAKHVRELEDAGLWVQVNGHKVVNDYLAYNPSRAKVEEEREAARRRMKASRSGERSGELREKFSGPVPQPQPQPQIQDQNLGSNELILKNLQAMQAQIGRTIE